MSFLWSFFKLKYSYHARKCFFLLNRISFLTGMYSFALLTSLILLILYFNNCLSQKFITNLLGWCIFKAMDFFSNVGAITMMRIKTGGCALLLPAVSEMSGSTLMEHVTSAKVTLQTKVYDMLRRISNRHNFCSLTPNRCQLILRLETHL